MKTAGVKKVSDEQVERLIEIGVNCCATIPSSAV